MDWDGVDSYGVLSCFGEKGFWSGIYIYQLLNFFGALGIIWNTFVQHAWPAMALNIVWAAIAIITILLIKKKIKHE